MAFGEQKIIREKNGRKYVKDDLTEVIIGIAYNIYNTIGYGFREKYYEECFVAKFKKLGLSFERQKIAPLYFEGVNVGKRRLDLIVENRIVIELKRGLYFSKAEFDQLKEYLVAQNIKLGLLIMFTGQGIKIKRVINID